MNWLDTAQGIIALITGALGIIGTLVGVFFAVKNWVATLKEKSAKEIWALIMDAADKAMVEAEKTAASGEDKKTVVINAVKAATTAAGIDLTQFLDQLDAYIDQCISFSNEMAHSKEESKETAEK